jgi:glutamate synthase domain-containing protein 3
MTTEIDSTDVLYRDLNERVRKLVEQGETRIALRNICGHKFIGDGLKGDVKIDVYGVPGNDLAAFMDGPEIEVHANGQDGIGNTMNSGKVIIHGHAGDVIGYAMRGGKIFIQGDVGYRVGIHMKSYQDNVPYIVVGGTACNFFGEYMAGGVMVLLGLGNNGGPVAGDYVGSGMHGGIIYVRGDIEDRFLARDVKKAEMDDADKERLSGLIKEYCDHFGCDYKTVMGSKFIKLLPKSHRPYGNLYAH